MTKATKASVDYGPTNDLHRDYCGVCRYFNALSNTCDKVQGNIKSDYWCKLFKRKPDAKEDQRRGP